MFNELIENISKKQENNINEGDFTNPDTELLMCGKCHTPKQAIYTLSNGKIIKPFIPCKCEEERQKQLEEEQKQREREQRYKETIKRLQSIGITDKRYQESTFDKDDNRLPEISSDCRKYVEHWEEMKERNAGILFYGGVGTGKSFLSCCVANELIKKCVPVLITNLSKLVNAKVSDNGENDVNLECFELLVIDDLGIENTTQTAYNIIDDWYKSGKPIIVTTNLTIEELKHPDTTDKERIYNRILEMCPLRYLVKGESRRNEKAKEKYFEIKKILDK